VKKVLYIFFLLPFLSNGVSYSQSVYAPLNSDYYWKLDRYEIKSSRNNPIFHSVQKPILRIDIADFVDTTLSMDLNLSDEDDFNFEYLKIDNHEWFEEEIENSKKPILKGIYRKKSDLFYHQDKDFEFHVNPVFEFAGGKDFEEDVSLYMNTRGVELRGSIDGRVGFYSYITDTQGRFPNYVRQYSDSNNALIHEGFWKPFKTDGYDYFSPRGYVTMGITKHIGLQFGFDRNFIGNGYRSLILSDFGNAYTFLKLNTRIWKINYTNIFAQMTGFYSGKNEKYPKKYMALHHFSINLGRNVNIGLSETVFFGSGNTFQEPTFEISYLNPVILYRALEHQLGSPDNVTVALDFKWNFLQHFSVYGQGFLDEFLLAEIRAQDGWWGNKYGFQLGMKYIDVAGIKNLDLQLETNTVRPFTYSHEDIFRNYAQYNQPLAHPLGSNFQEGIVIVRYQPINRLEIKFKGIFARKGFDKNLLDNNGGDIMKPYTTRNQEYGNSIGQGISTNINYFDFSLSYMLRHNLFIDFQQVFRNTDSGSEPFNISTNYSMVTLRLNKTKRTWEF
jgi:hypothetical protein